SDFPFVLLSFRTPYAPNQATRAIRLSDLLGNVSVLERPLHPLTLVSAVRAALRARGRQLEAAAILEERERVTAALRESEARFRAIAEGMPQLIWSARADGTHDFFNARWQELTGFSGAGEPRW